MNPKEFLDYLKERALKKPETKEKKTVIDRKIKPDVKSLITHK